MAAKPRMDGSRPNSHVVNKAAFEKLVNTCENAPRASEALRTFIAEGRRLVTSRR